MKIYKYYEGKVQEFEAKENKKTYTCKDRPLAFGCYKVIQKTEAATTAAKAITMARNKIIIKIDNLKEALNKATIELTEIFLDNHKG